MRVCVLGNSGSGKSTYAMRLGLPMLELDSIYWEPHQVAVHRPPESVRADLEAFIAENDSWVIEGCYAHLIEIAARSCDELVFLDLDVEACVANARRRPYEAHKFDRPEDQERMLAFLIAWIRAYPERADTTGRQQHLRVFEAFAGRKSRITDLAQLSSS